MSTEEIHMTESIAYAMRHAALSQYIAELHAKHLADRTNRAIVSESLAARAALLRLEREGG